MLGSGFYIEGQDSLDIAILALVLFQKSAVGCSERCINNFAARQL
jgi:hypothetical protein